MIQTQEQGPLGKALDWWTLGVLAFEMFNKVSPFLKDKRTRAVDYQKIVSGTWCQPWSEFPGLPITARHFVEGLLKPNPQERLGAGGPMEVMAHPYFEELGQDNWSALELRQVEPPWRPRNEDHFASTKQGGEAARQVMNPKEHRNKQGQVDNRRLTEMAPELEGWAFTRRATQGGTPMSSETEAAAAEVDHFAEVRRKSNQSSWKEASGREGGTEGYQFGDVTRSALGRIGKALSFRSD